MAGPNIESILICTLGLSDYRDFFLLSLCDKTFTHYGRNHRKMVIEMEYICRYSSCLT